MALIPKPSFPNVPKLPGVPQLSRSPLSPASALPVLSLGLALGALWKSVFAKSGWAIYKSNIPGSSNSSAPTSSSDLPEVVVVAKRKAVVTPDSFGEFNYRNEWATSDFPVQAGEFASYNKVANPFEVMVRMYKGGTKEDRKKFLDSIEAIQGTLDLYDIVTPERTYLGVNVVRYEVSRRGAKGAYFLSEVDLYFREIRQVSATYTTTAVVTQNAQNPSAAPVANNGVVQAITNVKNDVTKAVSSVVGKLTP
jgi:hypothetical protein